MDAKVKRAFDAVMQVLQNVSDPGVLTREEYGELLEELAADIDGRLDAVAQELDEDASSAEEG